MNQFVRQLCKQSIEPSIVEKLTEYKIKGFQFDRLVLGRIVSLFQFFLKSCSISLFYIFLFYNFYIFSKIYKMIFYSHQKFMGSKYMIKIPQEMRSS